MPIRIAPLRTLCVIARAVRVLAAPASRRAPAARVAPAPIACAAACAVLALSVAAGAADRRVDTSRLRVMSLNAEFLWDGIEPEDGSSRIEFPWRGVPDEALDHMDEIADVIIASDPDIVVLVEVENLDALQLLNSTFLTGRGYVAYLEKGRDTFTGQDIGILTRVDPIGDRVEYDDRKGTSGSTVKSMSKCCVARFDVAGRRIGILGVHLLSRPDDSSRLHQRQAQADAARSIADQLTDESFEVIVCGDFNDYDGQTLDHIDSTPITTVLASIKGVDPADPDDDLRNVAQVIAKSERFTAHWDKDGGRDVDAPGELTSIDHILVSESLFDDLASASIPHAHDPVTVTDHFPVVAEFDMTGFAPSPVAPNPAASAPFRIAALLPNPAGDETQTEQVYIVNVSSSTASLDGWTVRDMAGKSWQLGGDVEPGQWRVITRNGQPMAMNNSGDTVELRASAGTVIHTVSYGPTAEGVLVLVDGE